MTLLISVALGWDALAPYPGWHAAQLGVAGVCCGYNVAWGALHPAVEGRGVAAAGQPPPADGGRKLRLALSTVAIVAALTPTLFVMASSAASEMLSLSPFGGVPSFLSVGFSFVAPIPDGTTAALGSTLTASAEAAGPLAGSFFDGGETSLGTAAAAFGSSSVTEGPLPGPLLDAGSAAAAVVLDPSPTASASLASLSPPLLPSPTSPLARLAVQVGPAVWGTLACASYLLGALAWGTHFPERRFPGRVAVDCGLNSSALLHCAVAASHFCHFQFVYACAML